MGGDFKGLLRMSNSLQNFILSLILCLPIIAASAAETPFVLPYGIMVVEYEIYIHFAYTCSFLIYRDRVEETDITIASKTAEHLESLGETLRSRGGHFGHCPLIQHEYEHDTKLVDLD